MVKLLKINYVILHLLKESDKVCKRFIMQEMTFGQWTCTKMLLKAGIVYYLCRCSCGKEQEISFDSLYYNRSNTCRSCAGKTGRNSLVDPKVGDIIGGWSVLEVVFKNKRRHCICRCECGDDYTVSSYSLKSGRSLCCKLCASIT